MKACCESYMKEQFGDDENILKDIYSEYVSSVSEKITESKSALGAKDWTQLDRIAHTIKGNALAVGDADMADAAINLRKAAALCDESAATDLVAKMESCRTEL